MKILTVAALNVDNSQLVDQVMTYTVDQDKPLVLEKNEQVLICSTINNSKDAIEYLESKGIKIDLKRLFQINKNILPKLLSIINELEKNK